MDTAKATPDKDVARDLDRAQEGAAMDVDAAQRLGGAMGNSAIASMIAERVSAGSTLEEEEELDAEQEGTELEEDAGDQEVEQALPSFGGGGGGAGGADAPWELGRLFGGDDDGDDATPAPDPAGWRPTEHPWDPDEADPPELDAATEGTLPAGSVGVDVTGAERALPALPWRPGLLTRGMRHAARLGRVTLTPEALVDADGPAFALGRVRAIARFTASRGDDPLARALAATALAAGRASFVARTGYSGALARAASVAEALVARLGPAWVPALEVALDVRARAAAERAAIALAPHGVLSAPAVFAHAWGGVVAPASPPGGATWPPAMWAVAHAAALAPIPLVDRGLVPPPVRVDPDDAAAGVDALLAAFTGGVLPSDDPTVLDRDVRALLRQLERLVAACGLAQVEVVAGGLAVAALAPPDAVVSALTRASRAFRACARTAVALGDRVERLVGTADVAGLRRHAHDAIAARARLAEARDDAMARLARVLVRRASPVADLPPAASAIGAPHAVGLSTAAFERATAELRAGFPEAAAGPLREAAGVGGAVGLAARALADADTLARGEPLRPAEVIERLSLAMELDLPFAVACAAIDLTAAYDPPRRPLEVAAEWLAGAGAGGAANVVKARWGELGA